MECANAKNVSLESEGFTEDATVWQPAALGELVNIVRGRSYRSSELKDDSDTALVTLKSFQRGGGYRFDGLKPYVGQYNAEQIISPREIVVSQTDITQDGDVIGRPAVVPSHPSYRNLVASLDAAIVRNAARSRLDYGFLYYRLLSRDYAHHVKSRSTGTTVLHLSKDALPSFEFLLPPLPEQRRIAQILGALDDKIELNRRTNETLEQMARALFKSWFVNFDPVRTKMDGRWRRGESLPGMSADLYDLFPDRLVPSELGEIPDGWRAGPLADIVQLLSGGTPKTSIAEYWNGSIPWYTAKDAPLLSNVFAIDTERHISQSGVDNSATQILPARTTIISARGTVGRLACLGRPMAMNQTCYGIRGVDDYPDFFTYWNARRAVDELQARAHGTIFDTITRQTFQLVDTVIPPSKLAAAFEVMVRTYMDRMLANLLDSSNIASLRDALLPRLVSGDLRAKWR